MINPEIVKEYGERGSKVLEEFCTTLSDEEKDSIYAVDMNPFAPFVGVPFEITSTREDLVNELCLKTMNHYFNVDGDTIVTCSKYNGEGIKIWLTT